MRSGYWVEEEVEVLDLQGRVNRLEKKIDIEDDVECRNSFAR
jgi:hypothetical protein